MPRQDEQQKARAQADAADVKVVAEMPEDESIRQEMREMKEQDGYPGSCGGV